jgi:hypothetical protein
VPGDLAPDSVTQDTRRGRDGHPEALCGTLRAVRLEEVEEHAQDDYTRNDDGVGYVSEERRHPARHEQDDHQGIREESQ